LWEEQRTVDKTGCFSLHSKAYEVEASLTRQQVLLRYDPYDLSQIQVWYEGKRFLDAVPVQLRRQRHKGVDPAEPAPAPTGLNYLDLAKKQHELNKKAALGRMSYTSMVTPEGGKETPWWTIAKKYSSLGPRSLQNLMIRPSSHSEQS
jgi:hypothetical protein